MKRVALWVFATLLIAVAFAKPALVDSAFNRAVGSVAGSDRTAAVDAKNAARAAARAAHDDAATAVDYATPAQKKAAADARVGALGARSGKSHHTEMNPGYYWSACAPVRFALNTRTAPAGAVADFKLAIKKVDEATGLRLRVVGTTTATVSKTYPSTTLGGAYRPVLVAWGKAGTGILDRGASGTAYPYGTVNRSGQKVYVSGVIEFNTDNDHLYTPGFGQYGSRTLMYMHEIAHILGLDHVKDGNQMMAESVAGAVDAGAGDLEGLRLAGLGGCRG